MNNGEKHVPLALMSLLPPFTITRDNKMVASIVSGEYLLVDRKSFDEFVTEYLKLKGAE